MQQIREILDNLLDLLPRLGLGLFVFLLFILISWILKKVVTKRIKPKTKNPLLAVFIGKLTAFIITISGFILFLNIIGLAGIAKHIIAGAGITTFIIGFAFKDIGENFLSGVLMAFKSPFQIGDLIEINGIAGYVYELNMRESIIKTLDGKDVFIPNSQILKAPLFNYTIDGFLRYEIQLGVDYSSDLKFLEELIRDTLKIVPEVLQGDKKPLIIVSEFGTSTVNINILYWIDTSKSKLRAFHLHIKSMVIMKLVESFKMNNIYLPSSIIEIKNYSSEKLVVDGK